MSDNYFKTYPNKKGFFEDYGGSFIPEVLEAEMKKITEAYYRISKSHNFISELRSIRKHYQGRPTPVYYCNRLSEKYGGRIYLKREDLNHTGAHKLNHCMGEALLAKHLGKKRLIAETGAGQHGVALATAAAYFGLECEIHMGEVDIVKEHPNVVRMQILGAEIVPVTHGLKTLKEAVDSAFEAYLKDPVNTIYCIGSVVGPHPFPMLVRDFQRIVGIEARDQFQEMTGELPDNVVACVGGGSNSMGIFSAFLNDNEVELYGVEPAGRDINVLGEHAATISHGKPGVIHGFKCYMLQDEKGEPAPVYSVASGLDYPGVGPEHSMLHDWGRVKYTYVNDKEAIDAFYELSRLEGIIPALESAHAMAYAVKLAKEKPNQSILVNLSGRGDKDIDFVVDTFGLPFGTPVIKINHETANNNNQPEIEEVPVVSNNEKIEKDIIAEQEEVFIEEVKEKVPVKQERTPELKIEEEIVVEQEQKTELEVEEEIVVEQEQKTELKIEEEIVVEQEQKTELKIEEEIVVEQELKTELEVEEKEIVVEQEKVTVVEILDFNEEEKPVNVEEPIVPEKEIKTSSSDIIADKYNSKASVVGDRSHSITDVRKAISITDRFLYLKELFDNNMDAFNDALDEVNKAESLHETMAYLSRFKWEDNETSQQFMKLVSRRF